MSQSRDQRDAEALYAVLPNLEAEGFEVLVHPSSAMLPPFMSGFRPDAIAQRGEKKIAIEVMPAGLPRGGKRQFLSKLFADQPDWELRLIYAPHPAHEQPISTPSQNTIGESLDRIIEVYTQSGHVPALLYAWSVFEAAARVVVPARFEALQTPARLIEQLASDGYITPQEADGLRQLAKQRNNAAHGGLEMAVTWDELSQLVDVTRTLLNLGDPRPPTAGDPQP